MTPENWGVTSETLDGSWIYSYTSCLLGRAPQTKETLPDFCENMDPDKWDTTVWYRVTRNPQEFRELTSCQRDLRVLGRLRNQGTYSPRFFLQISLVASGCFALNVYLMAILTAIKLILLQKVFINILAWTIPTPLVRLPSPPLCTSFLVL